MTKLISVIVPVYNVEDYLGRFLKSVKDQTMDMNQVEVIIVNDGSTDDSLSVLSKFSELISNMIVASKENGGAASARNAGLEIATGEYVAFLDPDDYIEKDYLELAYGEAIRTGADIVLFNAYREIEDYSKNKTGLNAGAAINVSYWEHARESFVTSSEKDIASMQRQILYPYMKAHCGSMSFNRNIPLSAPWDKLYKRSFLIEDGLKFPEELKVLDDMCFNFIAFGRAKRIAYLPVKLYHYQVIQSSVTNSYKADRVGLDMKAFEYIEKNMAEATRGDYSDAETMLQAYYARIIKSFAICCRLQFFNPKNYKGRRQKLYEVTRYMRTEPYTTAFFGIKLFHLEWKLIFVALAGRMKMPVLLEILDLFENKIIR